MVHLYSVRIIILKYNYREGIHKLGAKWCKIINMEQFKIYIPQIPLT